MMNISLNDESSRVDDALKYKIAVSIAFQNNWKKHDEFSKLVKDYSQIIRSSPIINHELLNGVKARVMEVLKGHPDLILGFHIFVTKEHRITHTLQLETNGKKVKVEENCELPWDVLHIISKTLDFDDHFEFAGVCKNWRAFHKIYWRNFMASQEPLILQDLVFHGNKSFSFISIPDQKVYCSKMMNNISKHIHSIFYCYGGYIIMATGNPCLLINPFTRIKKEINIPTFEDKFCRVQTLLAFDKCSEEFVLVVLYRGSMSLHVYHSRNSSWVTYSTMENIGKVVDFVVLHNIIYVVTDRANIGVLSLNSASIKFLKLKSTPISPLFDLKLVNCDEELLVVQFRLSEIKVVYKIDFSTMSYVKLDTLGDLALFYAYERHCYALRNPNMWGYESNSVYVVTYSHLEYSAYSRDEKCQKYIVLPTSPATGTFMYDWCCVGDGSKSQKYIMLRAPANLGQGQPRYDWCFRHLRYEVDYSLVE